MDGETTEGMCLKSRTEPEATTRSLNSQQDWAMMFHLGEESLILFEIES